MMFFKMSISVRSRTLPAKTHAQPNSKSHQSQRVRSSRKGPTASTSQKTKGGPTSSNSWEPSQLTIHSYNNKCSCNNNNCFCKCKASSVGYQACLTRASASATLQCSLNRT